MFDKIIAKTRRNILWWKLISHADDVMLYYPDVKAEDTKVNIHIHDVIKTGYDYYDRWPAFISEYDYLGNRNYV